MKSCRKINEFPRLEVSDPITMIAAENVESSENSPQITAALAVSIAENQQQQQQQSIMQQDHFVTPGQPMGHGIGGGGGGPGTPGSGGGGGGGVGPIRVQQMTPQIRPMPYNISNQPQQQQTVRQMVVNTTPSSHYSSPINMAPTPPTSHQNAQYVGGGGTPIQMQARVVAPPPQPSSQQQQQHGIMSNQAGPSNHPMGGMMVQHQQQQQQQQQQQYIAQSAPPPVPQQPPMPVPQQQTQIMQQGPVGQPVPVQLTATSNGSVLEKIKLDELMMQINQNTVLEESVKDALVEYADDFVTSVIDKVCRIIKHRNATKIEARDIEFVLKNVYNMPTVPRASVHVFGAPEAADLTREKHIPTEAHKQRLALLRKHLKKI